MRHVIALSLLLASTTACKKGSEAPADAPATADEKAPADASPPAAAPGTEAEAKALLEEFLKPGADFPALSKKLQPTKADYEAVFLGGAAAKAEATYAPVWKAGQLVIAKKPDQDALLLFKATSEDLQNQTGAASKFPGGYKKVASVLKPGVTWYRFKFVKNGETLGMAYDGLTFVNGHWRIFPKPWRAIGDVPQPPKPSGGAQ